MGNKILKNLKLGLAGLILTGSLDSCTISHLIALKKYNPISKEQKDSLEINSGLREFLDKVYIIKEKEFKNNAGAHTHKWDGVLCLPEEYEKDALFHESAHVRHLSLNKSKSDFSKKWKQVADFRYRRKNLQYIHLKNGHLLHVYWRDGTDEPKNGMLSPYSATDMYEDAAAFVQALGYIDEEKFVKKGDSLYVLNEKLFPFFFADTTDHRYKQKLDLLKEYNFLTKEEHEKLSENLGSLHYLLEK